ncbi:MAG: GrpB family protein [Gemmatimonadota bacterium]
MPVMRDALIETTLGLESGTARVVAYDEQWPRLFEHAAAELREALGPHALGIHHVGSTAIDGLSAKPILDILVGIAHFEGVDPGALADPRPFLLQLDAAGIDARAKTETLFFDFPGFATAWNALAGVTTAGLTDERQHEAKAAVMPPDGDVARRFRNTTQFIIGLRRDHARPSPGKI